MGNRLSGRLDLHDFTVLPGETFVLDADLDVRATGDITVLGRIVSDGRTAPGSSIRLHTTRGNIMIGGRIAASPGTSGSTPPKSSVSLAGDGGRGGAIEIASDDGYVLVLVDATLETGRGGNGGDAVAEVTGAEASLVKAVSGAGGAGGPLVLSAGDLLIVEGGVRAGPGGLGGEATATGLARPRPPKPDADKPAADKPTAGGADNRPTPEPRPEEFPAVVEATGKAGGAGGDVTIGTTTKGGIVQLRGTVFAGAGGSSMRATATGARRATALLEAGGRGGNVAITLVESPLVLQVPGKGEIAGGKGGDSGDTSPLKFPVFDPNEPPVFFVDGAIASASDVALAWVGHPAERGRPAGGAAGEVTATAVWSGPAVIRDPIKLNVTQAEAGESTGASATVGGRIEHEWGADNVGAVPGGVMKVELP